VVTIGCRTSRDGDGGGNCVRASSPNQDNCGGGCYGAGGCCSYCDGTGCTVEMVAAVVAASNSKVALVVVLSGSFVI